MAEKGANADGPTCRCGHRVDHHTVDAKPTYGILGWFMLVMGATGTPKKITYRCRRCGDKLYTTKDPAVLRKYR